MDIRPIHPDEIEPARVLRAPRPGLFAFYEKLGFRVSTVAMERVHAR